MSKRTVIELRAMLETLPDDMEITFSPITSAFLGGNHPLRVTDVSFFNEMDFALPSEKGAKAVIYLHEEE